MQFICHTVTLTFTRSFIVSLSHPCKYFFLPHLSSTILLACCLFIISFFVLYSVGFSIFFSTSFFHLDLLMLSTFFSWPCTIINPMYDVAFGKLEIIFNALPWIFFFWFISSLPIFPHPSIPYSNAGTRQVAYGLNLTLIYSFPTWGFAPIAIISPLITWHFLFNSSFLICWLPFFRTCRYLFLERYLILLFILLLLMVPFPYWRPDI